MSEENLFVSDFDFHLPEELIAQQPPAERGASRMLVMDRATGVVRDSMFADLPSLLRAGDLLVLNDSRVIPARLYARRTLRREKEKPTGRIEVMLTEHAGENQWHALVRPGRKVSIGEILVFPNAGGEIELKAEVIQRGEFGDRLLQFEPVEDFYARLERIGHIPLPPYIHRDDAATDRERYQTVYISLRRCWMRLRREASRSRALRCMLVSVRSRRCAWSAWTKFACTRSAIHLARPPPMRSIALWRKSGV